MKLDECPLGGIYTNGMGKMGKKLRIEEDYNHYIKVMGHGMEDWSEETEDRVAVIREAVDATNDRLNWVFGVWYQEKLIGMACNGKFYEVVRRKI